MAPEAAELRGLIQQLTADDERCRWLATQALVELGSLALDPLLTAIALRPMGDRLRQCYLYILEHQTEAPAIIRARAIRTALRSPLYRLTAPIAASHCLFG